MPVPQPHDPTIASAPASGPAQQPSPSHYAPIVSTQAAQPASSERSLSLADQPTPAAPAQKAWEETASTPQASPAPEGALAGRDAAHHSFEDAVQHVTADTRPPAPPLTAAAPSTRAMPNPPHAVRQATLAPANAMQESANPRGIDQEVAQQPSPTLHAQARSAPPDRLPPAQNATTEVDPVPSNDKADQPPPAQPADVLKGLPEPIPTAQILTARAAVEVRAGGAQQPIAMPHAEAGNALPDRLPNTRNDSTGSGLEANPDKAPEPLSNLHVETENARTDGPLIAASADARVDFETNAAALAPQPHSNSQFQTAAFLIDRLPSAPATSARVDSAATASEPRQAFAPAEGPASAASDQPRALDATPLPAAHAKPDGDTQAAISHQNPLARVDSATITSDSRQAFAPLANTASAAPSQPPALDATPLPAAPAKPDNAAPPVVHHQNPVSPAPSPDPANDDLPGASPLSKSLAEVPVARVSASSRTASQGSALSAVSDTVKTQLHPLNPEAARTEPARASESSPSAAAGIRDKQPSAASAPGCEKPAPPAVPSFRMAAPAAVNTADQATTAHLPLHAPAATGPAPTVATAAAPAMGLRESFTTTEHRAAAPAMPEAFVALDAAPAAPSTTWVHAGTHEAEAGYLDPALGWVGVRAQASGGTVHAAIVPGSAEAAQTLSGHLAGLNAYVAERGQSLHVTMAAPGSTDTGAAADRQSGAPDQQQPRQTPAQQTSANPRSGHNRTSPESTGTRTPWDPPPATGGHISVVA